jgi:uncharacterized protein (DUF1697 family)
MLVYMFGCIINNMTRYVALLRGINVGGNNRVAMSDLRDCFEKQGFTEVLTYINSGNILFSSDEQDTVQLVGLCEAAIEKRFGFPVVTMVIAVKDVQDAMKHAPKEWLSADPKILRTEALFIIPPTKAEEVLVEIQKKSSSVDTFIIHGQVIFWTLPRAQYNKSVVPKIIGTPIYKSITIRGANTVKKLLQLAEAE